MYHSQNAGVKGRPSSFGSCLPQLTMLRFRRLIPSGALGCLWSRLHSVGKNMLTVCLPLSLSFWLGKGFLASLLTSVGMYVHRCGVRRFCSDLHTPCLAWERVSVGNSPIFNMPGSVGLSFPFCPLSRW